MPACLFTCPACATLFRAEPAGKPCLFPNARCRRPLRLPPAGQAATFVEPPGATALAVPARAVPLDHARLLRLRVWAADVRDGKGEFAAAPAEAAGLAKTLCHLLDRREGLRAHNARDELDGTVALLVGILVLSGVRWLA